MLKILIKLRYRSEVQTLAFQQGLNSGLRLEFLQWNKIRDKTWKVAALLSMLLEAALLAARYCCRCPRCNMRYVTRRRFNSDSTNTVTKHILATNSAPTEMKSWATILYSPGKTDASIFSTHADEIPWAPLHTIHTGLHWHRRLFPNVLRLLKPLKYVWKHSILTLYVPFRYSTVIWRRCSVHCTDR